MREPRLSFSIPRERKAKEGKERRGYPGWGVGRIQKSWPAKGAGTARPPRATGVEKVLGKVSVSRQAFNGGEVIEDAEKNFHFSSGF